MAILSFAHLKKTNHEEKVKPSTGSLHGKQEQQSIPRAEKKQSGVMSFAHLKKGASVKTETVPEKTKTEQKIFRFPAIAKTALIASVNLCRLCPRFIPATEWEKENGNKYGRCLRSGEIDSGTEQETWKVIPPTATVARCYYNLKKD